MRNLFRIKIALAVFIVLVTLLMTGPVKAHNYTGTDIITAASHLITLRIGPGEYKFISTDVIDVTNVLGDEQKNILNNFLPRVRVDDNLAVLLKRAGLIKSNMTVVGVIVTVMGEVDQVMVAHKKSLR